MEDPDSWCRRHGFESRIDKWEEQYDNASPFPHLVIDNFLPLDLAEEMETSFPSLDEQVWKDHGSHYVVSGGVACKYELGHKASFPASIMRAFDSYLFHQHFIKFVEHITKIGDLQIDGDFIGSTRSGGLNAVKNGGMLIRHADFNFSNDLQLYRAVNVLVYLNKGWSVSDGGNLDLWDGALQGPPTTVVAGFNRCLVFATNSLTYHGYNEVHGDQVRKSLNLYFFTKTPALNVEAVPHKTKWKPVDAEEKDRADSAPDI